LFQNERDFDATMMNFVVIGEVIDKLSDELKDNNPEINWSKIYGLRNLIAHDYFGINVDIICQIIKTDIPNLRLDIIKLID